MPTIEIDQDVFDFLRSQVQDFRETESAVLRRLHNLPSPNPRAAKGAATSDQSTGTVAKTPLGRYLADMHSSPHRTATDKFLAVLSFVHQQDPEAFARVTEIGGRKRKYFAGSRKEISSSGTSTHPKRIPNSQYWVMTNADTRQKRDMLRQVLRLLRHSSDDIRAAVEQVY